MRTLIAFLWALVGVGTVGWFCYVEGYRNGAADVERATHVSVVGDPYQSPACMYDARDRFYACCWSTEHELMVGLP